MKNEINSRINQFEVVDESNISWHRKFSARIVEGPNANTICKMEEAYEIAKNTGNDLIVIKKGFYKDGIDVPAIVKITDYNKFIYEQKKHEKENAKKQRESIQKVKEVKFHIGIGDGDYNYKLNHIKEFLENGDKVNCQIILRGREKYNENIIIEFLNRLTNDCEKFAEFVKKFNRNDNNISGLLIKKATK